MNGITKLIDDIMGNMTHGSEQFVCPIFWTEGQEESIVIKENGTMFCVRSRESVFYVTAKHVFDNYRNHRKCKNSRIHFGNRTSGSTSYKGDINDLILCESQSHDLVTFQLPFHPKDLIPVFLDDDQWPPIPTQKGDLLTVTGYLYDGLVRESDGFNHLIIGNMLYVTEVRAQQIIAKKSKNTLNQPVPGVDGAILENLGGLSGCPALDYDMHLNKYVLKGVYVSMIPHADDTLDFEILSSKFIHPNGVISLRGYGWGMK